MTSLRLAVASGTGDAVAPLRNLREGLWFWELCVARWRVCTLELAISPGAGLADSS